MPENRPKPFRDERPWGDEIWLTQQPASMVKIIRVKPGQALSLQYHHGRDEFWHVISGSGTAELDGQITPLKAGDDFFVPREAKHRIETQDSELVFIELCYGNFDEKDIVRIADRYGRI